MKNSFYVLITLSLFQNIVLAEDHSYESKPKLQRQIVDSGEIVASELLAKMGEEESSSGYRQLFLYSPRALRGVEMRIGDAENWSSLGEFKSDTHKAYGTKSFLPSAPGQKFTIRAIREDGTRVTSLLVIDSKNPSLVEVKTMKEEPRGSFEEVKKTQRITGTSSVLTKAQSNIGHRLGSGDCSALRGSGPALGRIGGGGVGVEQLMPGQVLRLSPGAGLQGSMGYFRAGETGHYIVVESVNPNGQITFLDQNWAGGSSSGQFVRRASGNLRTLNGSATIYSGN